jgi:hypothetical protein
LTGYTFRDFVIYTDYIDGAGKDAKGRPKRYSVRVFDSPVGEGEREEEIKVRDWNQLEKWLCWLLCSSGPILAENMLFSSS